MNPIKKQIEIVTRQMGEQPVPVKNKPDVFTIVLTSVGTEIISFREKTNKISEDDDNYLTDAITQRIMRKLKEYNLLNPKPPHSNE